MCDVLTARVAELEASLSKFEPKHFYNQAPRPVGHQRYTIEDLYLVNIYTKDGNFWVEGERFEFFQCDFSKQEKEAAEARKTGLHD
eukprot:COSAG05_NODE_5323_length_1207_cov_1.425993_1_plen_85_part_10